MTQALLKERLHYDPESGVFMWLVQPSLNTKAGSIAGCKTKKGYRGIKIFNVLYEGQRLAWLYMTGAWPVEQIDHKNRIRDDNRWDNLREATRAINGQNQRPTNRKSATGLLGVTRRGEKFKAGIKVNGKSLHLGTFADPFLAHQAYLEAKQKLHPGSVL